MQKVHLVDQLGSELEERGPLSLVHVQEWAQVSLHQLMCSLASLLQGCLLEFEKLVLVCGKRVSSVVEHHVGPFQDMSAFDHLVSALVEEKQLSSRVLFNLVE